MRSFFKDGGRKIQSVISHYLDFRVKASKSRALWERHELSNVCHFSRDNAEPYKHACNNATFLNIYTGLGRIKMRILSRYVIRWRNKVKEKKNTTEKKRISIRERLFWFYYQHEWNVSSSFLMIYRYKLALWWYSYLTNL